MSPIKLELAEATVSVDATLIAEELGLEPAQVLESVRTGQLTARCEQGIGEDAGRFRLMFYRAGRRLRLTVDQEGCILECSTARLRKRLSPPTAK